MICSSNYEKYSFDIDKIIEYLEPFKNNLPNIFLWNTPNDNDLKKAYEIGLINKEDYSSLLEIKDSFTRNSTLKRTLHKSVNSTTDEKCLESYYLWIIKDWGGIRTKKVDGLSSTIGEFLTALKDTGKSDFKSIASISKVVSFMNPEEYIIYDSRVAYSLNWILLKSSASNYFFPIPDSRNRKLLAFDMKSLIRLKNINTYSSSANSSGLDRMYINNKDKDVFISEKDAYGIMCGLIKDINEVLWEDCEEYREYPFYTEMLLFALADRDVFEDILRSCNLSLTQNV